MERKMLLRRGGFWAKKEVGREGKGGDVRSNRKMGFPKIPLKCVSGKSMSLRSKIKGGAI